MVILQKEIFYYFFKKGIIGFGLGLYGVKWCFKFEQGQRIAVIKPGSQ